MRLVRTLAFVVAFVVESKNDDDNDNDNDNVSKNNVSKNNDSATWYSPRRNIFRNIAFLGKRLNAFIVPIKNAARSRVFSISVKDGSSRLVVVHAHALFGFIPHHVDDSEG